MLLNALFPTRDIGTAPANFEPHVLAVGPAQLCQRLQECLEACLRVRTKPAREHADSSHGLWLLRPRNHWPGHRITDKSEKLSPPHVRALVRISDRNGSTRAPEGGVLKRRSLRPSGQGPVRVIRVDSAMSKLRPVMLQDRLQKRTLHARSQAPRFRRTDVTEYPAL